MQALNKQVNASKTNSLKQPYRNAKNEIKKQSDYELLQKSAKSYSEYRPTESLFKVGKLKKEVVNKYKDQKNNNEASEATPPSPLPEDNNATPTSLSSGLIPFSPNLMQFPALRKLLDITGNKENRF